MSFRLKQKKMTGVFLHQFRKKFMGPENTSLGVLGWGVIGPPRGCFGVAAGRAREKDPEKDALRNTL